MRSVMQAISESSDRKAVVVIGMREASTSKWTSYMVSL